ncbi:MAG: peptidase and chymotrypsin/Hap, partial [Thermoleophilia bacterium]|nr:peptidase and chymotrypsin/Hap [Thermoleophilia bacterium]
GPLYNARGEVLGIVQQIAGTSKTSSGVAFAIPATIVQRTIRLSATNRDIPYAWTGLKSRDLTPQLAKSQGIGTTQGALVQDAAGPAQQAGISVGSPTNYLGEEVFVGDVVTNLAGQPIASSEDLRRVSGLLVAGETVSMTVMRGTSARTVQLTPTQAQFAPG